MRLPGSTDWKQEDVATQIAFERAFAAAAPQLVDTMNFLDSLTDEAKRAPVDVTKKPHKRHVNAALQPAVAGLPTWRKVRNFTMWNLASTKTHRPASPGPACGG